MHHPQAGKGPGCRARGALEIGGVGFGKEGKRRGDHLPLQERRLDGSVLRTHGGGAQALYDLRQDPQKEMAK